MAEHTKTPWQVFPKTSITARAGIDQVDGISIVCIGCDDDDAGVHGATAEEAAANAALIVRAVNSHDTLVKALAPFVALAEAVFEKYETRPGEFREAYQSEANDRHFWGFNNVSLTYGDLRRARAALASAQSVEGE